MCHIKKATALFVAAALLILLCGCAVHAVETETSETGTVEVLIGCTKNTRDELTAYLESKGVKNDPLDVESFVYKGSTYYGKVMRSTTDKPGELEMGALPPTAEGTLSDIFLKYFSPGNIRTEELADGNLLLHVTTPEKGALEVIKEGDPALYAVFEKHEADIVYVLNIDLPGVIQQTGGCFNGVSVDGGHLALDYMKMAGNGCHDYSFSVQLKKVGDPPLSVDDIFVDVDPKAWYAPAVEFMARTGLMAGYGDGRFGPDDNLTIPQFAQVLATAQNLETGAGESGWWAEKAVEGCVKMGWLTNRGAVNEANYGDTIRRQEAIAAMQRASQMPPIEGKNVKPEDISDYDQICEKYRPDIVAAFNSGIVSGVDEYGTILPLNTLTRAEVSQLFYNLGWGKETPGSVTFDGTSYLLKVGEKVILTLPIPEGIDESLIVWVSSDPKVVTVSRGLAVAVGEGTAVITAKWNVLSVSCTVSVVP